MIRAVSATLLAVVLAAGCGGATQTAPPTNGSAPTAAATQTVAPAASPAATPVATPTESINAFPTGFQTELETSRYESSPPFDVPFTFAIPAEGWSTAHMHHDFFDVMRFDGPDPVSPTAWVAWGVPVNVIGTEEQPAADLTPAQAAELMSSKPGVTALEPVPFTFLGRDGVQVDLRAELPNTFIFGNGSTTGDGNFGLDPNYPMLIGIVENDPGLLFVLCIAPDDEADSGCGGEQQQIIDSAQ